MTERFKVECRVFDGLNWWIVTRDRLVLWRTDLELHTTAGYVANGMCRAPGWQVTRAAARELVRKYKQSRALAGVKVTGGLH